MREDGCMQHHAVECITRSAVGKTSNVHAAVWWETVPLGAQHPVKLCMQLLLYSLPAPRFPCSRLDSSASLTAAAQPFMHIAIAALQLQTSCDDFEQPMVPLIPYCNPSWVWFATLLQALTSSAIAHVLHFFGFRA